MPILSLVAEGSVVNHNAGIMGKWRRRDRATAWLKQRVSQFEWHAPSPRREWEDAEPDATPFEDSGRATLGSSSNGPATSERASLPLGTTVGYDIGRAKRVQKPDEPV